jgi:hypothetical protein
MARLIAFGNRKNVGKDTAARFLCSHLRLLIKGSNIQVCGFADKIKDMTFELYKWAGLKPKEYYETRPMEKDIPLPLIGRSPREIWINFGTLVGREIYFDTWVDHLFHNTTCELIIIKDLRFPNEAERIKKHGGMVIKINRPSVIHTPDIADTPLEDYNGWTHVIENDGTLADFNKKIIALVDEMKWLTERVA